MRIDVTQPALARALKLVTASIHGNMAHERLCRITAKDGRCNIYRADSVAAMSVALQGQIVEPGAVAVNAVRLMQIADTLNPNVGVSLHATDDELTASSSKGARSSIYTFPVMPPEDIPRFTEPTSGPECVVPVPALRSILQRTKPFPAKQEDRTTSSAILSVNIRIDGGQVIAVATDTHKLVETREDGIDTPLDGGANIPPHAVSTILAMLDAETDDASVSIMSHDGRATFRTPQAEYQFTLLQGRYPNYERILQTTVEHEFVVDRHDFSACLGRLGAMDTEANRCELWAEGDGLLLKAGSESGSATERIMADFKTEELLTLTSLVAFNLRHARALLGVIASDAVRVTVSGPASPIKIRPEPDKGALVALLMPKGSG